MPRKPDGPLNQDAIVEGRLSPDQDEDLSYETSSTQPEANVFLNVYDIVPSVNACSRYMCGSKWGIYHTGVEVDGLEFSFGGHADESTGVFCAKPGSAQGCTFRQRLAMGWVELDHLELRQHVAEIAKSWPGNRYDPFQRNCNHFSDVLCKELTGRGVPAYINKFTRSPLVRSVFYRCVVPLGRCVERFNRERGGVSYSNSEGTAADEGTLGVTGARGINEVLLAAAATQKEKANRSFKAGAYQDAREAYRKATGYLDHMSHRSAEEEGVRAQAQAVRLALLLNLAACGLKEEDWAATIDYCNQVIAVEPENSKALYRRGVARSHVGGLEEAMADLRRVLQLAAASDAGTVRDVRREIERVRGIMEGRRDRERQMARRMLGSD